MSIKLQAIINKLSKFKNVYFLYKKMSDYHYRSEPNNDEIDNNIPLSR